MVIDLKSIKQRTKKGWISTGAISEKPEGRNEPQDVYVLVTKNNKGTTKKNQHPPTSDEKDVLERAQSEQHLFSKVKVHTVLLN